MESINSIGGGMSASDLEAMKAQGFERADINSDGGIDKEEMQGVLDKFTRSEESGSVTTDDIFSEFDEDEDGVLSEDEMAAAMEKLHEEMEAKGPGKGGPPPPPPEEAAASYAANSGQDTTQSLADLLASEEEDEDEEDSDLLQELLDGQQSGTLSGYSSVDLLA